MFAAYPRRRPAPDRRLRPVLLGDRPGVSDTLALRDYLFTRRLPEDPARIAAVLAAHAPAATAPEVAAATGLAPAIVGRATAWLLKYHFLEDAP